MKISPPLTTSEYAWITLVPLTLILLLCTAFINPCLAILGLIILYPLALTFEDLKFPIPDRQLYLFVSPYIPLIAFLTIINLAHFEVINSKPDLAQQDQFTTLITILFAVGILWLIAIPNLMLEQKLRGVLTSVIYAALYMFFGAIAIGSVVPIEF